MKYLGSSLSWRRSISYKKQSIDFQSKSMDWFLYDRGPRRERINTPRKEYFKNF